MIFFFRRIAGLTLVIIGLLGLVLPILPGIVPIMVGLEIAGLTILLPGPLKKWRMELLEKLERLRRRR